MKVHWKLKLPTQAYDEGRDQDLVFRDRNSFASYLGKFCDEKHVRLHEEWNGLDFTKQMAIIVARFYTNSGPSFEIESIWKTANEIVIVVRHESSFGEHVLQLCGTRVCGVCVNRSDLPVRFHWYSAEKRRNSESR